MSIALQFRPFGFISLNDGICYGDTGPSLPVAIETFRPKDVSTFPHTENLANEGPERRQCRLPLCRRRSVASSGPPEQAFFPQSKTAIDLLLQLASDLSRSLALRIHTLPSMR